MISGRIPLTLPPEPSQIQYPHLRMHHFQLSGHLKLIVDCMHNTHFESTLHADILNTESRVNMLQRQKVVEAQPTR